MLKSIDSCKKAVPYSLATSNEQGTKLGMLTEKISYSLGGWFHFGKIDTGPCR